MKVYPSTNKQYDGRALIQLEIIELVKKVIAYNLRNIYTHHTCHCTAASKILYSGNDVSPINQKDRLGKTIFLNVHGVIGVAKQNQDINKVPHEDYA